MRGRFLSIQPKLKGCLFIDVEGQKNLEEEEFIEFKDEWKGLRILDSHLTLKVLLRSKFYWIRPYTS
jgi:hypothetical protein